jgi:hypothetical protein
MSTAAARWGRRSPRPTTALTLAAVDEDVKNHSTSNIMVVSRNPKAAKKTPMSAVALAYEVTTTSRIDEVSTTRCMRDVVAKRASSETNFKAKSDSIPIAATTVAGIT